MAISANHLTEGGSDVDANSFTTASIAPTANALVLAAIAVGQTGAPGTPTLTGNGLTWVLEDSALYDITGTFGTLFLFRALGASPSSGTLVIAFGGITHLACVWAIDEFTGVDTSGSNGAGAIVQSVSEVETDLGTTASVTMAAFSSVNNSTYGAVAKQTAEDFTQGSGFTILSDFNVATPVVSVLAEWKTANDTVVDCSWATAGQKSGIIGVELKAAAVDDVDYGYQRIYGPAHLGTSATDLFTVPTGKLVRLRHIYVSNPSGSPVDFTFSIGTDAAATRLYSSYNIPAGGSLEWAYDHALVAGEKFQAYAGSATTLVMNVDAYVEPV